MSSGPTVLFRCDGSPEIGLGHVVRCLALADELHRRHSCQPVFAMRTALPAFEMVRKNGYRVVCPPDHTGSFEYGAWLAESAETDQAQVLILDVRDELPIEAVRQLRGRGVLVVALDDPSPRRLAADLAFYPPVPQVQQMSWAGFTGRLFAGWEWVVLRRGFACPPVRPDNEPPRVLVTMGGSDPAGLTMKAIVALERLNDAFEVVVVLGLAFRHQEALTDLMSATRRPIQVRQNVASMAEEMAHADIAVASFGVTAYELAAAGVPAIYLCLTQDHAWAASIFAEQGMAVSLGIHDQVTPEALAAEVRALLNEKPRQAHMAELARRMVDGRGAIRVADEIVATLKRARAVDPLTGAGRRL
jgi:spore coat polysaccharide biosynthesis protein SpsF